MSAIASLSVLDLHHVTELAAPTAPPSGLDGLELPQSALSGLEPDEVLLLHVG